MIKEYRELDPSKPVCILRSETGDDEDAEVLTEHGRPEARVFSNVKAARRWIKRNVISPAERQKLYFVQAPHVK